MDIEVLEVTPRDKSVKASQLRREGMIPAEYYGHGVDNLSLQMDYQTFRKLYRRAGENTIIEVKLQDKKVNVLVHNIALDPVRDEIVHVDFIHVNMDEEVHTNIPLRFVGTAPAVKDLAGIFTSHYNEVEVKCLPKYLVHDIEVDISGMEDFTHSIHFEDLVMPEGIEMLSDPAITVAAVSAPRLEEEPVDAPVESAVAEAEASGGDDSREGKEEGGE